MLQRLSFSHEDGVNTSQEVILSQVEQNIRRGLPQAQPHEANPWVALLVCGGPSLNSTLPQLIDAHWRGGRIVTVNGSYGWCIEKNLRPSATVVLDGREFKARFVEQDVPGCRYLLSSQCHPRTFDVCRDRDILLWHTCSGGEQELELLKKFYFDQVHPVTIGTTVAVRAISLLRMLGFLRMEIFGLDSCWMDDQHHAYAQPENNSDKRIPVTLGNGEKFICAPWHVRQAEDFMQLTKERGDLLQLKVHGNGLISTMIRVGSEIAEET